MVIDSQVMMDDRMFRQSWNLVRKNITKGDQGCLYGSISHIKVICLEI